MSATALVTRAPVHPEPYQLFPPLRPEEYAALKADIERRGVLIPVELDEDGAILDGHHRAEIAAALGIDPPTIIRHFDSERAKREHVIKLNLARRHLDAIRWGQAFELLLAERGVQLGQGARNDKTSATVAEVATELGVPARTARSRVNQFKKYDELSDAWKAKVDAGRERLSIASARDRREKQQTAFEAEAPIRHAMVLEKRAVAGLITPIYFEGHEENEYDCHNKERADIDAVPVLDADEWAHALTLRDWWAPLADPCVDDPAVRDGCPTRAPAWIEDGRLILSTGRWIGAEMTFPDGRRERRRWWRWDALMKHEAAEIRKAADPGLIQYARLATREAGRAARTCGCSKVYPTADCGHRPDYIDTAELEAALVTDLAAVRAQLSQPSPNLNDPRAIYAAGESAAHFRDDEKWRRFGRFVRREVAA